MAGRLVGVRLVGGSACGLAAAVIWNGSQGWVRALDVLRFNPSPVESAGASCGSACPGHLIWVCGCVWAGGRVVGSGLGMPLVSVLRPPALSVSSC